MELIGTNHIVTAAYRPQSNGQTESFNQTLIKMLRTHAEQNPEDWPKLLNFVLMAYRNLQILYHMKFFWKENE